MLAMSQDRRLVYVGNDAGELARVLEACRREVARRDRLRPLGAGR